MQGQGACWRKLYRGHTGMWTLGVKGFRGLPKLPKVFVRLTLNPEVIDLSAMMVGMWRVRVGLS